MKRIFAILFMIFCVSTLARSAEDAGKQDLVLDLTCSLPADGYDVDSGVVVARLYEYDPRLADVGAAEIARVTISGLTHKKGKDTILHFPLHGKRSANRNYYVTVFVHPTSGEQRLYFIDGFQNVFEGTDEQALSITLKSVERSR